jgi:hypothetical protein
MGGLDAGREALEQEILRLIAEAASARRIIRATAEADRLESAHPASGMTSVEIEKMIVKFATPAGVTLVRGNRN